jgi:carbamoyl-phosphate synthase large subunit
VTSDEQLERYITTAVEVDPERPVLVDKYLEEAIEIDVDALADSAGGVTIGGIMEHIEQAGVHSGDSACSLPTQTVSAASLATIRAWTPALARELGVVGLLNIQYAVRTNGDVYILEANPRASRTVPFVAKAVGHPLAKYASLLMAGSTLAELGFTTEPAPEHVSVKEAVLPFDKFPGADTLLGPEMRSTGEVMGIDGTFIFAYAKAQIAAGQKMPLTGTVFVSVRDADKAAAAGVAGRFAQLGFNIVATGGSAAALAAAGVPVTKVLKIHEGRPHIGDMLRNGDVDMLIVSSSGDALDLADGRDIRRLAVTLKIPLVTTMSGARATVEAIAGMQTGPLKCKALQDFF